MGNANKHKELLQLIEYATILSSDKVFKNEETMQKIILLLEDEILKKYHKYPIYFSESENSYRTYIKDDTNAHKRKAIKRRRKEDLVAFLVNFYKEQYLDNSRMNMTLRQLYEEWMLYRRDSTSTKAGTIRKNKGEWDKFYRDSVLADMRVADIKPIDLVRFFRTLTKDRTYTRKCITNIRALLNGILSYALEEEIISSNPLRDVNFKSFTYKPVENQSNNVFTKDDVSKLLEYLNNISEPYALAIQLAFNLFIRIGELKAIKWEDINIDNRSIYLNSQITQEPVLNDDLTFSPKKIEVENHIKGYTSHGFRTEYLTDDAIRILEKVREINPDGEFIFMPHGRPMSTDRFNIYLKRYCKQANIPYHSSHKIRFFTASVAYNGQNLVTISKMLGHSQTATTMHYLRDVIQENNLADTFQNLGYKG